MNNTFIALSTPYLSSAIAIIRINGEQAYNIVNKITKNKITKVGYSVQKSYIYDNEDNIIDESIFVKFVSPKSFTGDDLIEINCHGGPVVIDTIIELLIKNGAQLADNGYFTKRAFINNKISLLQANSINNLINSKTKSLAKLSIKNITNNSSNDLKEIQKLLFDVIGKIEVNIDYPEYDDVEVINHKTFILYITKIIEKIEKIINNYKSISHIYSGINIAIIGKPNVGKSSLLNSLLKKERAIISNIAGTTRDTINDSIIINDILYNFIDTAGIRNSKNKIESIGIKKSLQTIKEADFIIFVIDNSKIISSQELDLIKKLKNKKHIIVKNKSDLKIEKNKNIDGIKISAKTNNTEELINHLTKTFKLNENFLNQNQVIASKSELNEITNINNILINSIIDAKNNVPLDVIVSNITNAYKKLSIILGEKIDFDILDHLFKNFCLGK